MKTSQISFFDLVSAIILLIILLGNFFGLLFITSGNSILSLLISLFIVVCYYYTIQLLTDNKEALVTNKFPHKTHFFWLLFFILGFVSYNLISHFINIEYNFKTQIQKEANDKLKLVESFGEGYEKRANDDFLNYYSDLVKEKGQQFAKEQSKAKDKKLKENILYLKDSINKENAKFKSVFENWNRTSVMSSYNKLNEYVKLKLESTNSKLSELPKNKSPLENTEFDDSQIPLNNPLELNKRFSPSFIVPFLIILITHLFVLIPFLFKKIPKRMNGEEPSGAIIL